MKEGDPRREPTPEERARAHFYVNKWLIPLQQLEPGQRTARVRELAEQEWEIPYSRRRSVSETSLWRLHKVYSEQGLSGLYRKPRRDAGQARVLPPHIVQRAIEIRIDLPSRSLRRILKMLAGEYPLEMGQVKRSTLSRALTAAGHRRVRPQHSAATGPKKERHIRMRWERPLQLVQSDVCGQTLWVMQDGKLQKVSLIAVLDHCSKLCLHGEWFVSANLPALEKCVVGSLLSYGVFERLHVDNGKIYASYLLENICGELGIALKYAKAYYAEGKGGIERFWLTVEDDFIQEIGDSTRFTLGELNKKYAAWQHEYNTSVHSATGEAPAERYQRLVGDPRWPDAVKLRQAAMLREQRTVDKRFCSVHVRNREFVVDSSLRGKRLEVRYDPFVLDEVLIYDLAGTRLLQRATPLSANEKPAPFLPAVPAHRTPEIDALSPLEEEMERDLRIKPRVRSCVSQKAASFAGFCQQVGRLLMRASDLDCFELALLQECWQKHGPFDAQFVGHTLEPLIAHIGHGLHVVEYLNALASAHLTHEKE